MLDEKVRIYIHLSDEFNQEINVLMLECYPEFALSEAKVLWSALRPKCLYISVMFNNGETIRWYCKKDL